MKRSTWSAVALCILVPAVTIATAAKAEPTVLTTAQLETISAGQSRPFVNVNLAPPPVNVNTSPVQLNLNVVKQVAVATSISIAVCAACKNSLVTAASGAAATNINLANLQNF